MAAPPRPGPEKVSGCSLAGRKVLLDLLLKYLPGRDFGLQEFPEFLQAAFLLVGAFLVAECRDLCGLHPCPHRLYPLLNRLQAFMLEVSMREAVALPKAECFLAS